jgi:Family of unknown function (DUF5752)
VRSQSQRIIRLSPISSHATGCARILSKKTITKKLTIEKRKTLNLKSVPFENGFHFFTEVGKYTGITASSTVEFAEKLQIIPIESVMFHFQRQDFQKWFKNTVGDEELAKRIDRIEAWSSDENLRKELFKTVHNRITELTKSSQQISS